MGPPAAHQIQEVHETPPAGRERSQIDALVGPVHPVIRPGESISTGTATRAANIWTTGMVPPSAEAPVSVQSRAERVLGAEMAA